MNAVKCAIEGCLEEFRTEEAVSSSARFICKNHPRSAQLKTVGRLSTIETEQESFQDFQFDSEIGSGVDPIESLGDNSDDESSDSDSNPLRAVGDHLNPFWSKVRRYDATKVKGSCSKKILISQAKEAVKNLPKDVQDSILDVVRSDDRDHQ